MTAGLALGAAAIALAWCVAVIVARLRSATDPMDGAHGDWPVVQYPEHPPVDNSL